ncbi:MAG: HEAT repeat domain-containing protein [Anaerolineales bacterium]
MTTTHVLDAAGFKDRLAALFGVEKGEGSPVTLMMGLYFVISVAFVFVQTTAFALFLQDFGSRNLPYAYLSVAVLSSLVAFAYLRFSQHVRFSTSLYVNLFFLSGVCLLFWAGLLSPLDRWFVFLLPFWFQTLVGLANLIVWHLAGHIFNVRQAKRLFGLIGAGNWLANILGGLLVAAILTALGTANLYLLAALALATSALLLRAVFATPTAAAALAPGAQASPGRSVPAVSPFRHPYSRLIFSYTLLWWIGFVFIDNIFFDLVGRQITSDTELAAFLGRQLSAMGVIALVATAFLTSYVARKYGLLVGLLAMPVVVVACILVLALGGSLGWAGITLFWIATAAKTFNVALGFSISQAMGLLLYQPLLGNQRNVTQTIAEGIIQPVAIGVAGLVLLLFNTALHFDAIGLSYLFLGIAVVWFWEMVRVSRAYPLVMSEALRKRSLGETTSTVIDSSALDQIRRSLSHPSPGLALYALNQLEHLAPQTWPSTLVKELPALMAHPSEEVRREALNKVFAIQPPGAIPILRRQLETEETPEVYAMLVQILSASPDGGSSARVLEALESPDRRIRRGAITGLLSAPTAGPPPLAVEALSRMVYSPNVEDRVTAAEMLGETKVRTVRPMLLRLMADGSISVRHAALRSAGAHSEPEVLESLMAACDNPDTVRVAEKVLVKLGPAAVSAIAEIFAANADGTVPRARMRAMLRVLGRIWDPRSVPLLFSRISVHDTQLRLEALRSLSRLGFRSRSRRQIMDQVASEASLAAWLAAALHSLNELGSRPELQVLRDALEHAFAETRGRILLLLSFAHDSQAMLRAHSALQEASAAHSPLALETVDAQLPPAAKPLVLPLLEDLSYETRLKRWRGAGLSAPDPTLELILRELIRGRPEDLYAPWLRMCAMQAAVSLNLGSCTAPIEKLVDDGDALVREMSRWSLRILTSTAPASGGTRMLSPVERVLILKSAPLFADTPDNVLAELASLVEEVALDPDQIVFNKGDRGDSLYIVVSGSVKVWDGDRLLNELSDGDAFGELALLDPEPRLATVKAAEATRLLRLEQAHFREVLDSQPEVSAAILRVVTRYLRGQLQYARDVNAKLRALESFGFLDPSMTS